MSNNSSSVSRSLIAIKECLNCRQCKEISEFKVGDGSGTMQWLHCKNCREILPAYAIDYSTVKDYIDAPEKKPSYSKITVSDGKTELSNNYTVTWDKIRDLSNKQAKSRRRNKVKSRKNKPHPWKYTNISKTTHEENERRRFEKLWFGGYDEGIPFCLIDGKDWNEHWLRNKVPWSYAAKSGSKLEANERKRYERFWEQGQTEYIPKELLKKNALWTAFWNGSLEMFFD